MTKYWSPSSNTSKENNLFLKIYFFNSFEVYEAFNDAPQKKVRYIRRMRENGEKLNSKPRIILSTIHGVKGSEQDNVVLLTDLSRNTQRNYEKNPDDENRLFYVGATRTKNHLHIIRPKDIYKGNKIWKQQKRYN